MKPDDISRAAHLSRNASRREFLRFAGIGATGIGLSGIRPLGAASAAPPSAAESFAYSTEKPKRPKISFAKTVTLDVSSGQNIDDALRRAMREDTLVRIPPGTYEISQSLDMPERAGIEGMGDIGGVALRVTPNRSFYHVNADSRVLYIHNLHYDLSEANNGTGMKAYVWETGYVGDVTITGHAEHEDAPTGLALAARKKDAYLMVERFKDVGRGTGSHTGQRGGNGRMGIWSGSAQHEGLAYIKDCSVIDVANNGIYAARLGEHGRFHVDGGVYKHNYGAGVRTGGNGSIIENVYIEVDMRQSKRDWWGAQPAIRWEVKGKSRTSAGLIRNCDIRMINGRMAQGIRLQRSAAKVAVENCRVQIEEPETTPLAVYGTGPDAYKFPPKDKDTRVYIDGLHVTGSAATQTPSITIGDGRDGSVVKNCFVPGGIESESRIITKNNVKRMGKPVVGPNI